MSTPRPTEADVEARMVEYERAWLWNEATDETLAGWGHHMGQMLFRLPHDGQTRDMQASIEAMLADLRLLAARDAEHERDRSAHSIRADLANLRAERWMARHDVQRARAEAAERDRDEARRELADLQAKVAALMAECEDAERPTRRTLFGAILRTDTIRDLLPTEDDQ